MLVALVVAAPKLALAIPSFYVEKIHTTPDLLQTDPRGRFANKGRTFCAPAAVSNSLIWLASAGILDFTVGTKDMEILQMRLTSLLASKYFMNTSLKNGTGPIGVLNGVNRYLKYKGLQNYTLSYQGWRPHQIEFSTGEDIPKLSWIKERILGAGAVWLNVGWYRYKATTNTYRRIGGHWLTLTGYGVDKNGKKNPNMLILNDPGKSAGAKPSIEYVLTEEIPNGILDGELSGLPRSAVGFLKLTNGMNIKRGADFSIIDGVVGINKR